MNIPYKALDQTGRPYLREARTIGELPFTQRTAALQKATPAIAKSLGLPLPARAIWFGQPVWRSFGFVSIKQVLGHPHEKLLLTPGADIPLSLIPIPQR